MQTYMFCLSSVRRAELSLFEEIAIGIMLAVAIATIFVPVVMLRTAFIILVVP